MIRETKAYTASCNKCEKDFVVNSDFDIEAFFTKEEILEKMGYEDWIIVDKHHFCSICVDEIIANRKDLKSSSDIEKYIKSLIDNGWFTDNTKEEK